MQQLFNTACDNNIDHSILMSLMATLSNAALNNYAFHPNKTFQVVIFVKLHNIYG